MKPRLIYALPVILAACGPTVSQSGGAEMPAPAPLKADKAPAKAAAPAIQETAFAGTWAQTDPETAVFTSEEGTELVKIRCLPGSEEVGTGPALAIQRTASGNSTASSLDVFTGAGGLSLPASVDAQAGLITGTIAADAPRLSALMVGQGELKLQAGTDVYVLENSQAVEAVVEACRPAPKGEAPQNSEAESSEEAPPSQM